MLTDTFDLKKKDAAKVFFIVHVTDLFMIRSKTRWENQIKSHLIIFPTECHLIYKYALQKLNVLWVESLMSI